MYFTRGRTLLSFIILSWLYISRRVASFAFPNNYKLFRTIRRSQPPDSVPPRLNHIETSIGLNNAPVIHFNSARNCWCCCRLRPNTRRNITI
ncbi:hypothetical protein XFF6992_290004 [Xanthomonas citri pv. fuscans]|nr:hypothetical protein XFF6992_290004 [Xanthomonas citri pv. fuscans]SOO30575.1 hypothetical protein XFF6994_1070002 [Xanthomonas citri pv. fuscans]SOO33049.1 hypothetical protein XFF6994_2600004 [Xanthomonas citri pv. fuscans]